MTLKATLLRVLAFSIASYGLQVWRMSRDGWDFARIAFSFGAYLLACWVCDKAYSQRRAA